MENTYLRCCLSSWTEVVKANIRYASQVIIRNLCNPEVIRAFKFSATIPYHMPDNSISLTHTLFL